MQEISEDILVKRFKPVFTPYESLRFKFQAMSQNNTSLNQTKLCDACYVFHTQ